MKRSVQKKISIARERMSNCKNKAEMARKLGIARSSLYYKPKKPKEDEKVKERILEVLEDHPAYGHKRISLELKLNKKRILRVMNRFGIRPRLMRKRPDKDEDKGNPPTKVPNIAKTLCPLQEHVLWSGDFTYLPWHGGFIYVATVLDVFTRKIVGVHVGLRHTTDLVVQAFLDATMRTESLPQIFHSDQGSEYVSGRYEKLLENLNVTPSHSNKASPWENCYQESFYNNFKLEFGNAKRLTDLGELTEAVMQQIHYYNFRRIHTSLKMPPNMFAKKHRQIELKFSQNKITAKIAV